MPSKFKLIKIGPKNAQSTVQLFFSCHPKKTKKNLVAPTLVQDLNLKRKMVVQENQVRKWVWKTFP
jgi:hypothetical protein